MWLRYSDYYKKELTSYRGDFSQANVNRASIGRAPRQDRWQPALAIKNIQVTTDKKDNHIELLVEKLCGAETNNSHLFSRELLSFYKKIPK